MTTPKLAVTDRAALPPVSVTIDDAIMVRGLDLANELIGQMTFTQAMLLDIDGAVPTPGRVRMVDAILVALMEHGITPSSLATRVVLDGAPEALQGAVAAGLLATGSRFLGTIEQAAAAIRDVLAARDDAGSVEAAAHLVASRLRREGTLVPGVGHNLHSAVDPRVAVLLKIANAEGVAGPGVDAFHALTEAASAVTGRSLLPNTAGLIGALLVDLGYEPAQARGFALIARCAGLVAHIFDEQARPVARETWVGLHERMSQQVGAV